MKQAYFLIFFLGLFPVFLMAESPDSSVVFKASFLKDETQSYEISKTRYTLHNKDTTSMERLSFQADVHVTDSTESYYTLNWNISGYRIHTGSINLQKMIELAKPIEISYRITKPGALSEFLNGENVTSCLEAALPKVLEPYLNRKDTVARVEVARIYDLRESLETLLLRFIVQFHQAYGLGYTLGEVVDVPTEINSRFSSTSIPGTIHKKLVNIDRPNHLAVLSTATTMDQAAFRKALAGYLKADAAKIDQINQMNTGSIVLDLATGWVIWSFDQREETEGNRTYGELVEIQYK
jgi:hypothetical protein